MPKYDFKCQICNATVELYFSFADDPIGGTCCGIPMQRDYTTPAVHFKGTGWGGSK